MVQSIISYIVYVDFSDPEKPKFFALEKGNRYQSYFEREMSDHTNVYTQDANSSGEAIEQVRKLVEWERTHRYQVVEYGRFVP